MSHIHSLFFKRLESKRPRLGSVTWKKWHEFIVQEFPLGTWRCEWYGFICVHVAILHIMEQFDLTKKTIGQLSLFFFCHFAAMHYALIANISPENEKAY